MVVIEECRKHLELSSEDSQMLEKLREAGWQVEEPILDPAVSDGSFVKITCKSPRMARKWDRQIIVDGPQQMSWEDWQEWEHSILTTEIWEMLTHNTSMHARTKNLVRGTHHSSTELANRILRALEPVD